MDAVHAFAGHVARNRYEDMPAGAHAAARTFILDTIGVGLAGTRGPLAAELADAQELFGRGEEARVWGSGKRLPVPAAAFCNAYQAHNSEFDCVHEAAVAHVVSVVLPVALAGAERAGRQGRPVDGRRLLEAVILGVDVAASLGLAATTGLRFFRPATVGLLGATAALGKLAGLDEARLVHAFSIAYAQLSGTMQAHTEGSMLLAMQVGFAARNAAVAVDLAGIGVTGPQNILEGPFGYFKLIEAAGEPARLVADLGRVWRITEVAHKPFPSGRATHGVVDLCLELQRREGFAAADVAAIEARVPPLVHHLVGRPPERQMAINYARLCAAYCAARVLVTGGLAVEDFRAEAYADPATHDLARRVTLRVDDRGDPNALTPVEVAIALRDGRRLSANADVVYGNPAKPMTRDAHLDKFRRNAAAAASPLDPADVEALIAAVDGLETLPDVTQLVDFAVAREVTRETAGRSA
jgi:aconitate decarboxylase